MRLWTAGIVMGALALPLAACNEQAAEQKQPLEAPTRQPGLWKQITSVQGMGGLPPVNICLDEAADKKLAWWAQQGVRGNCDENQISKGDDDSWSFHSVCRSPQGMTTTTEGKATGEFQSSYRVQAQSTTVGAPNAQMNGTYDVIIDATRVGDCPAGMKGGDMQLPDGSVVNLLEMTGG